MNRNKKSKKTVKLTTDKKKTTKIVNNEHQHKRRMGNKATGKANTPKNERPSPSPKAKASPPPQPDNQDAVKTLKTIEHKGPTNGPIDFEHIFHADSQYIDLEAAEQAATLNQKTKKTGAAKKKS